MTAAAYSGEEVAGIVLGALFIFLLTFVVICFVVLKSKNGLRQRGTTNSTLVANNGNQTNGSVGSAQTLLTNGTVTVLDHNGANGRIPNGHVQVSPGVVPNGTLRRYSITSTDTKDSKLSNIYVSLNGSLVNKSNSPVAHLDLLPDDDQMTNGEKITIRANQLAEQIEMSHYLASEKTNAMMSLYNGGNGGIPQVYHQQQTNQTEMKQVLGNNAIKGIAMSTQFGKLANEQKYLSNGDNNKQVTVINGSDSIIMAGTLANQLHSNTTPTSRIQLANGNFAMSGQYQHNPSPNPIRHHPHHVNNDNCHFALVSDALFAKEGNKFPTNNPHSNTTATISPVAMDSTGLVHQPQQQHHHNGVSSSIPLTNKTSSSNYYEFDYSPPVHHPLDTGNSAHSLYNMQANLLNGGVQCNVPPNVVNMPNDASYSQKVELVDEMNKRRAATSVAEELQQRLVSAGVVSGQMKRNSALDSSTQSGQVVRFANSATVYSYPSLGAINKQANPLNRVRYSANQVMVGIMARDSPDEGLGDDSDALD